MGSIIQSLTRKNIFLAIVLSLATSFVATKFLLNSQNVFFKNEYWLPYKVNFYGMHGDGIESLVDRSKIGGGKLRGYHNRVFSRQELIPESIDFKFVLRKIAYIDILFNANEDSFEGIRIPTNPDRDSIQYKSDYSGKFLWKKNHPIKAGEFGIYQVSLFMKDGSLILRINNRIYELDGSLKKGKIGFDPTEQAFIWDVNIRTADGKVIEAPFKAQENFWEYFLKNLGIILPLIVILTLVFRSIVSSSIFLLLLVSITFAFDFFYYSRLLFRFHPLEFTFLQPYEDKELDPETFRFNAFKKWYKLLGGTIPSEDPGLKKKLWSLGVSRTRFCRDNQCKSYAANSYPHIYPRSENSLRVLIWGGSLSAGTTLTNLEQSYPDIMYKKLQQLFPDRKVELMNTSRGEVDFRNFAMIEEDNKHFYPDVFLIDAFVIKNHHEFEGTIKKLEAFSADKILLKPPINVELYDQRKLEYVREKIGRGLQDNPEYFYFLQLDPFIKRWQRQYDLDYIDGNLKLLSPEVVEGGHLFWDMVHLTAYGHQIWGEYLAEELARMIKERAR